MKLSERIRRQFWGNDKLADEVAQLEEENDALKRSLEKRLRQEYTNEDHRLGGISISFEQFYEAALLTQRPDDG